MTVLFAAVIGAIGTFATVGYTTNGDCTSGSLAVALAIPANTVLLIVLAFVQQRHYRSSAKIEKIVNRRHVQEIPPPDGTLKRGDDGIS